MPAKVGRAFAHITPHEPKTVRKPSKFKNVRVTVDGITFDSAKEARRWSGLKLAERAGDIRNLTRQRRYPLDVNGVPVTTYVADFDYEERRRDEVPEYPGARRTVVHETWHHVTEDVKGGKATQTDVFKVKAKLFAAIHGREIRIT